jgi:hypothetical protein
MNRIIFFYLLLIIIISTSTNSSIHIELENEIQTFGAAGFEYFNLGNNNHFLVCANFWDGIDDKMGSKNSVHKIIDSNDIPGTKLSFPIIQRLHGRGSHGADLFKIIDSSCLVIPNYYQCDRNKICNATKLYLWNNDIQKFDYITSILSSVPGQTDNFMFNGDYYIIIAENFISKLSIYKIYMNSNLKPIIKVEKTQDLSISGVASCATIIINNELYLIGASYHNGIGWETTSIVYKFNDIDKLFYQHQTILTTGPHDVETISFNGKYFLFFSEDRNEFTSNINSNMYIWDDNINLFIHLQSLTTDGAHASELFIYNNKLFLAIANFGDRQNKRYDSFSSLWEYEEISIPISSSSKDSNKNNEECNSDIEVIRENNKYEGLFNLITTIPTFGATDFEYFNMSNNHYLIVSEEGDLQKGLKSYYNSHIYKLSN